MVVNISPTIAHVDVNKVSQDPTEVQYALANMPQVTENVAQRTKLRDGNMERTESCLLRSKCNCSLMR
jgi:hypothetical protein